MNHKTTPPKTSTWLLAALILAALLIIYKASGQEATNAAPVEPHVKLTPQVAAYTFKEWVGVITAICTTIYAAGHSVFLVVVHYGGLRKMWADFMGNPSPDELNLAVQLLAAKTLPVENQPQPAAVAAQPKEPAV